MKEGDRVVCIGEYCYNLKKGDVYEIAHLWTDNTITLVGHRFNYSVSSFIEFNEYRISQILKIKGRYN